MFYILFIIIINLVFCFIYYNRVSRGTSTTEDKEYKSPYLTKPVGSNSDLPKGANNDLLLYVKKNFLVLLLIYNNYTDIIKFH